MGGLFGSSKPTYTPPPPPAAPVEEATFKPGGNEEDLTNSLNKKKLGKKSLQIPLTTTTTATPSVGLNTGA